MSTRLKWKRYIRWSCKSCNTFCEQLSYFLETLYQRVFFKYKRYLNPPPVCGSKLISSTDSRLKEQRLNIYLKHGNAICLWKQNQDEKFTLQIVSFTSDQVQRLNLSDTKKELSKKLLLMHALDTEFVLKLKGAM